MVGGAAVETAESIDAGRASNVGRRGQAARHGSPRPPQSTSAGREHGIVRVVLHDPDLTMSDSSSDAPRTAHANGIDLCYETFGDASKPAVLLVMGLGTQMLGWDEQFCRQLAGRGWFVIRFDNRDIGRSTWFDQLEVPNPMLLLAKAAIGFKPKVPYTLKDMAADTVGLLDALGIAKAHVVGASMGGMIGQEMAVDHPDRMRSFTSIMSSTGNPKLPAAQPEATSMLVAKPAETIDEFIVYYRKLLKMLRAGEFPEDEALDEMRARQAWARGYHPAGSARQLAAIIASGNRTEALTTVRVPTLVIHGRPDPLVPVEGGQATAAAIPGAKLLILERMGHALPLSCWDEVVGAIDAHARSADGLPA
jgi:pimeloyl-ACP methyl ester carboxylesterase